MKDLNDRVIAEFQSHNGRVDSAGAPAFATYQRRASRRLPVIRLTPRPRERNRVTREGDSP